MENFKTVKEVEERIAHLRSIRSQIAETETAAAKEKYNEGDEIIFLDKGVPVKAKIVRISKKSLTVGSVDDSSFSNGKETKRLVPSYILSKEEAEKYETTEEDIEKNVNDLIVD